MKREDLAKALIVTSEVMGAELSPAAAEAMARELVTRDRRHVWAALQRCQRELVGRLSLARVLERMPGQHVGAEEAWALCPRSEDQTVVWTEEIAQAFGAAAPLLAQGDAVAARMAFRETYARLVAEARANGQQPRWWPSLGHDARGRAVPIQQAVESGRLSADAAQSVIGYLPEITPSQLTSGPSKLGELVRVEGGGRA
jgi:hypothetical protein